MAKAKKLSKEMQEVKEMAESNLKFFAAIVNDNYMYGDIHREVFDWFGNPDRNDNQLLLIPRAHLKSHCVATYTAWRVVTQPETSFVYLSAGEDLAKAQIYAIKNMLTSPIVRKLWPELINEKEGDREVWNAFQINVDHPKRKEAGTRDATIIVKTLGSSATGLHADEVVYDDVVVPNNAYTEVGRKQVADSLSDFGSVLNPNGLTTAVGTLYHPKDCYQNMKNAKVEVWDEELKEFTHSVPMWDIKLYAVEDEGDMTGNYLWPQIICPKTMKAYGFNPQTLAKVKAKYMQEGNAAKYQAQYYNDPNDISSQKVGSNNLQYIDAKDIKLRDGKIYYNKKLLNIACAMDVAWTTTKRSDYTAIAVCGMCSDGYKYVLGLDQYKTSDYTTYYESIMAMHNKYKFKKIIIETNSGGKFVAEEIKKYIRREGKSFQVEGRYTTKSDGNKNERYAATLEPPYLSNSVFHINEGFNSVYEEQLKLARPKNDDLKDAVTTCFAELKPPPSRGTVSRLTKRRKVRQPASDSFGGRQ